MILLDGNFALGCEAWNGLTLKHTFQGTLERTDAITDDVLALIMFFTAYPTV